MEPNLDLVSYKTESRGEGLVGDQETDFQAIPRPKGNLNWTKILAQAGLESPGYHEVVEKMKKEGRVHKNAKL